MKIKLQAFGIAKDIIGGASGELDLSDNATIVHVKDKLTQLYPGFESIRKFSIAVNQEYQDDDFEINEGDELVIIPPVSGG